MGIGNTNSSGIAKPEVITALKAKVAPVFVSAGHRYAAAITAADQLFTWGDGSAGQLGCGPSMTRSTRPSLVSSLRSKRVLAVACGGSHVLAVVGDASTSGTLTLGPLPVGSAVHDGCVGGALYVWGSSAVGALGLGPSVTSVPSPTAVPAPCDARVTYIAAGLVTSAAVTAGANLFLWGDCSYGRLGIGEAGYTQDERPVWAPTPLSLSAATTDASGAVTSTPLLPQLVALGGCFSIFVGRPASAPPGSPGILLATGIVGADVLVLETVVGSEMEEHVGGTVGVVVKKPPPGEKAGTIALTPTLTATLGSRAECVGAAAGASHYAVILRETAVASAKKLTLLEAAKRAQAGGESGGRALPGPPPPSPAAGGAGSSEPVRLRGVVYTAGYGYLGHDRTPMTIDRYASAEPVAVGGNLADEGAYVCVGVCLRKG
jgi:hypothetical protein